jgi:thioredoxin-related protein
MRRAVLFLVGFWIIGTFIYAQHSTIKIYNPEANAREDLNRSILEARQQGKHVMIQIGGNWCPWCIKMHHFFEDNARIDSIIKADYVFLRINYSKENKNLDVLKRLEYPQRFGFPVLVILDADGKRLHTQDTGFLEENEGYSEKKVLTFLREWNVEALDPEQYK